MPKNKAFYLAVMSAAMVLAINTCYATITLKATWYSVESLHRDGQWNITHGRCADGSIFKDEVFTCATRLFPLGTRVLIISRQDPRRSVIVCVTDRIGKRFAKTRIDLSPAAFKAISPSGSLNEGILTVNVKEVK